MSNYTRRNENSAQVIILYSSKPKF